MKQLEEIWGIARWYSGWCKLAVMSLRYVYSGMVRGGGGPQLVTFLNKYSTFQGHDIEHGVTFHP